MGNAAVNHSLMVRHKDGKETSIAYQEGMKITFSDKTMKISGSDTETGSPRWFEYELDDLSGFRFDPAEGEQTFSGVEEIRTDKSKVSVNGLTVTASGLKPGQPGFVFDTAGRILMHKNASQEGEMTINLSGLQISTAIIKIADFSTKLHIK